MAEPSKITALLNKWQGGHPEAESALFVALYDALYAIAVKSVRSKMPGDSIGPTALVNEAYVRLAKTERISLTGRSHFLALSARVMRRIVVDRARAHRARKRDGLEVTSDQVDIVQNERDADMVLAVDRALESLSKDLPEETRIVELRWFAGYSEQQIADIMGISARTVKRRWQLARIKLKVLIDGFSSETDN